jgi:uncharacterized membrane protein YidH (DUF202 family)
LPQTGAPEHEAQANRSNAMNTSDDRLEEQFQNITHTLVELAKENNQLTTNLISLAEKRNTMAEHRTVDAEKRTLLAEERTKLTKGQSELTRRSTDLAEERTRLSTYRTEMAEKRTGLAENRTDLAKERTNLAELRTGFSRYRSVLAKGRTELAFIRTGLAFVALGIGMMRYFGFGPWTTLDIGIVVIGAASAIYGGSRFITTVKSQRFYERKMKDLLVPEPKVMYEK